MESSMSSPNKEEAEDEEADKERHQQLSDDHFMLQVDDKNIEDQSSSKKRTNNELDDGIECDRNRNCYDQHDRNEDSNHRGQKQKQHGQHHRANGKRLREMKKQKFEAKQQRKKKQKNMLQQSATQANTTTCRDNDDEDANSEGHETAVATVPWFHYQQHKYPDKFAHKVTKDDVELLLHRRPTTNDDHGTSINQQQQDQNQYRLQELLSPYINIKDGGGGGGDTERYNGYDKHRQEDTEEEERVFIAEGTETIRILIQQQEYHSSSCSAKKHKKQKETSIENNNIDDKTCFEDGCTDIVPKLKSIFVKPSVMFGEPVKLVSDVDRVLQSYQSGSQGEDEETMATNKDNGSSSVHKIPPFHVLVGEDSSVLSQVAGFKIGRGALACGIVPQGLTEAWLDDFLTNRIMIKKRGIRLLALDGVCDTANLGSMIRTASALGVDAIVLSSDCCDEWYRRSVRVSMGHLFLIPVVRVSNLAVFLNKWSVKQSDDITTKDEEQRLIHSYAAVVADPSSSGKPRETVVLEQLQHGSVSTSWCCVLGNEGNGISNQVVDACTDTIRIGMKDGVDSLSVVVACGILLHGLSERELK